MSSIKHLFNRSNISKPLNLNNIRTIMTVISNPVHINKHNPKYYKIYLPPYPEEEYFPRYPRYPSYPERPSPWHPLPWDRRRWWVISHDITPQ